MMPPANQKKTDAHEQDFIMTLQRALGKPIGTAAANSSGQAYSSGPPDPSDPSGPQDPFELFGTPPPDLDNRLKAYTHKSQLDRKRLLDLFVEQAGPINLRVIPVENVAQASSGIQQLIQQTNPEWGTQKSVIAWQHPLIDQLNLGKRLAKDDVTLHTTQRFSTPDSIQRQELRSHLIQSYIGITSADFCVAQSATLVMRTRPGQPRAVSLVPSIHVAVITMDQIIDNLAELYFRLKWDPREQKLGLTNCMTFISGPSKTGDIELVMVHGAHGPRQMIVYVITNQDTTPST